MKKDDLFVCEVRFAPGSFYFLDNVRDEEKIRVVRKSNAMKEKIRLLRWIICKGARVWCKGRRWGSVGPFYQLPLIIVSMCRCGNHVKTAPKLHRGRRGLTGQCAENFYGEGLGCSFSEELRGTLRLQ